MKITLLITNHCNACLRAIDNLEEIKKDMPYLDYEVMHVKSYIDNRICITPAWIVDGELFNYGELNTTKLKSKLKG